MFCLYELHISAFYEAWVSLRIPARSLLCAGRCAVPLCCNWRPFSLVGDAFLPAVAGLLLRQRDADAVRCFQARFRSDQSLAPIFGSYSYRRSPIACTGLPAQSCALDEEAHGLSHFALPVVAGVAMFPIQSSPQRSHELPPRFPHLGHTLSSQSLRWRGCGQHSF